jgi:hypothetical protein
MQRRSGKSLEGKFMDKIRFSDFCGRLRLKTFIFFTAIACFCAASIYVIAEAIKPTRIDWGDFEARPAIFKQFIKKEILL